MVEALSIRDYYLYYVAIGAVIFALGLIGFLARRNLIMVFLCTEIMLQGTILSLMGYSIKHMDPHGQAFSLLLLVVAAAEAALALALVVLLFRHKGSLNVEDYRDLRG